jgi:hypothetical protein
MRFKMSGAMSALSLKSSCRNAYVSKGKTIKIPLNFPVHNLSVEKVPFLLRILVVPGSTLGPQTGYPDYHSLGISRFFQENAGIVLQIRPTPIPSTVYIIHE